jgi:hypothetical protein
MNAADSSMVSHPYSIYIWQPPFSPGGLGHWKERIQAYTEQWAVYVANLMHRDSRSVIKVVSMDSTFCAYQMSMQWNW